ncbi:hypothetical protein, partial [Paucisalibacillus globulus]|uniref:hypothetical protein n=1 Tax=Paucisalibacillus globulus TaxID=351095 RepID=UPI001C3E8ED5
VSTLPRAAGEPRANRMLVTKALPQDEAFLAFEPLFCSCGVSPKPIIPQDKVRYESDTSHAEKVIFFFKESPCISFAGVEWFKSAHRLYKLS